MGLCWNVTSPPTCLEGDRCPVNLENLYHEATSLSTAMYARSFLLIRDFKKQFSRSPSFFKPAMKTCHTFIIRTPAGRREAKQMQNKDIIDMVLRLLHSWNEPLRYLTQEAKHLPKFNHSLTLQAEIIAEENYELQDITSEIASKYDTEIAENVDYALWPGLQVFKSFEEPTRLFTFYNTLHCLFGDAGRISILLQHLKCQESTEENCKLSICSFHF
ncbi:prolactin-like [Octodon degus]|uniref:Prolactin n=1 Tax=Octodon degus TaxID=10160 RepID=A0A6P3FXX4_OCTDE|nr:prolactin-like [Octodon degus]